MVPFSSGFGGGLLVRVLSLVLALCLMATLAEGEENKHSGSNQLEGINPFPLDYDSGSMALYALKSSLDAYDVSTAYQRLTGLSGTAFKFVYDSTEAYEPLRDLYPMDALAEAATALGFYDAKWVTGKPIGAVKDIIKHEIDSGRPVLAPFLKADAYRGFFIVTGYDFDRDLLYLQGAFEGDSAYVTVPIPETWDGPTVSPAGWATNPVFVIGEAKRLDQKTLEAGKEPVERAISAMKGGSLPYGLHPGERAYMGQPGPHEALYGFPAYDLLSHEIEHRELIDRTDGGAQLDFAFLWRINSQVGQLEHDRRSARFFAKLLSRELPDEKRADVSDVMQSLAETADDAGILRKFFWHVITDTMTAGDVAGYVKANTSMVFRLPDVEPLLNELQADGFEIFETAWGWLLVDDTPRKRTLAKTALRSIIVRERRSLDLLEGIADHIGIKPSGSRPEGKPRRPPRGKK
ncbi:MAG: hypothetical protein ABIJ00_03670 [Candidatus Eisenbacteria bacterium]